MNQDVKNRINNVLIFSCCYIISLSINILLGFGKIEFGDFIIYSIIFGVLEIIQLLFLNIKIQLFLFFVNIYFAYCFSGICLIVIPNKEFFWKEIFNISFHQYFILLVISIIFSLLGYFILFIKYIKRKTREK